MGREITVARVLQQGRAGLLPSVRQQRALRTCRCVVASSSMGVIDHQHHSRGDGGSSTLQPGAHFRVPFRRPTLWRIYRRQGDRAGTRSPTQLVVECLR